MFEQPTFADLAVGFFIGTIVAISDSRPSFSAGHWSTHSLLDPIYPPTCVCRGFSWRLVLPLSYVTPALL